jgi:hypothetical protein
VELYLHSPTTRSWRCTQLKKNVCSLNVNGIFFFFVEAMNNHVQKQVLLVLPTSHVQRNKTELASVRETKGKAINKAKQSQGKRHVG